MNIDQFNFDSNVPNKRKPTLYLKVAAVVLLSIALITVISLYIILRVGKSKEDKGSNEPFTQTIESTIGSYYGYSFDLSYYGSPAILGSFLSQYYPDATSLTIRGNVFSSGMTFTIYPDADSLDDNLAVYGVINESGVYIDTYHLGELIDPTGATSYPSYSIKVAGGMRGEDITKSFIRILTYAEENDLANFGNTTDGLVAVEISEVSTDLTNLFTPFTNSKVKLSMSAEQKNDGSGDYLEVKGDSDAYKFKIDFYEDQSFRKRPEIKNTILSVEEFKSLND